MLFISLALALLVAVLIPATAWADTPGWKPPSVAKHFSVILTPTSIDDTTIGSVWPVRNTPSTCVWPIVDSTGITGWIIDGRSIRGGMGGDINGDFIFTYGGVLDVLQSGSMQGIVTLKANTSPLDVIYLAADGDLAAQVKEYYTFPEIQGWCTAAGIPIGMFFAAIYGNNDLALLPPEVLGGMYGSVLPPLPKTLTATFSGTVRIDAGTGAYAGVRGNGQFGPNGKQPLTLHVYPNQHVYQIDGQIKMTGTYMKQKPREIGNIDRGKLQEAIDKFKEKFGR